MTSLDQMIRQTESTIAAQQALLSSLKRLPEKDEFPLGTVLKWDYEKPDKTRIAIKLGSTTWAISGYSGNGYQGGISWEYLLVHMKEATRIYQVDSYKDITKEETVEISVPKMNSRYEVTLVDRATGMAWHREGDRWERVSG